MRLYTGCTPPGQSFYIPSYADEDFAIRMDLVCKIQFIITKLIIVFIYHNFSLPPDIMNAANRMSCMNQNSPVPCCFTLLKDDYNMNM